MIHTRIIDYFREGLWQQPHSQEKQNNFKKIALCYLKIFILSTQGFINDHGTLRASALTLYTILSIVPVIAMLFGIANGFGFDKVFEAQLLEYVHEKDGLILPLISMAKKTLDATKDGVVAGFGLMMLFWTVIKVIGNIEESFNHIWDVKTPRSFGRKLSDYLSLMLLAPILIAVANSISIIAQAELTQLVNAIALPALYLLSYLPILILCGLFSFLFIFIPNARVSCQSGIFAGIITGVVYHVLQSLYISLQIGVSSYNAIYGSFAALPLFIVWLQIAWVIVLFGSELSFFHQNIAIYQFNQKYSNFNFNSKIKLSLLIMHTIMTRFSTPNSEPYCADSLSLTLQIPISVVQITLAELLDCDLLVKIDHEKTKTVFYQPARDRALLTDDTIIETLKNHGEDFSPPIAN